MLIERFEFSKFRPYGTTSIAMLFCLPVQNVTEIDRSAAELLPKTICKVAVVCRLDFFKFSYLVIRLSSSSKSAFVYQIEVK